MFTKTIIQNGSLSDYLHLLNHQYKRFAPPNQKNSSEEIDAKTLVEEVMKRAVEELNVKTAEKKDGPSAASLDASDGDLVMQLSPGLFKVRVMLEDPFPPGTFQVGVMYIYIFHSLHSGQVNALLWECVS